MRRLIRDISSVLILSGLLLVLDAGVTVVWQEPVTAAIGMIMRDNVNQRYLSYRTAPLTDNDATVTAQVAEAFGDYFGDRSRPLPMQMASEDFSDIPDALGVPYTYWGIGGTDPDTYRAAETAGTISRDIPVNHSSRFAPVVQPTLDTGTEALVTAALAWLADPAPG